MLFYSRYGVKKSNFTLVQIVGTPIDIASSTLNELNVVLYLTTPSYEEFAIYSVLCVLWNHFDLIFAQLQSNLFLEVIFKYINNSSKGLTVQFEVILHFQSSMTDSH